MTQLSDEVAERPRQRLLQWPVREGYLRLTYPSALSFEEVEEIEQVIGIALKGMREAACEPCLGPTLDVDEAKGDIPGLEG